MQLLLKILFFIIVIFHTNITEAKIVLFGNAFSGAKFTYKVSESKNESIQTSEIDVRITCKNERGLVDYRNLAINSKATAAMTGSNAINKFYPANNVFLGADTNNTGLVCIPKCTPIKLRIIGPQGSGYPGGSLQFIMPSSSVINQSSKLKIIGINKITAVI